MKYIKYFENFDFNFDIEEEEPYNMMNEKYIIKDNRLFVVKNKNFMGTSDKEYIWNVDKRTSLLCCFEYDPGDEYYENPDENYIKKYLYKAKLRWLNKFNDEKHLFDKSFNLF